MSDMSEGFDAPAAVNASVVFVDDTHASSEPERTPFVASVSSDQVERTDPDPVPRTWMDVAEVSVPAPPSSRQVDIDANDTRYMPSPWDDEPATGGPARASFMVTASATGSLEPVESSVPPRRANVRPARKSNRLLFAGGAAGAVALLVAAWFVGGELGSAPRRAAAPAAPLDAGADVRPDR
jgi:hypothetical protein